MRPHNSLRLRLVAACGAVVLMAFASHSAVADDPSRVTEARRILEAEAKAVLLFAHPTTEYKGVRYEGCRSLRDGYVLSFTVSWVSAFGNDGRTTMAFYLDAEGDLDFCKSGSCTALVPCFHASDAVIQMLKDMAADNEDLRDDRELMRLLEKGNAKELLEWYLKAKGA